MGYTIAQKIIKEHLLSGEMKPGNEISIKIDQTLTQDSTGTMAYLQFEAIGVPSVRTELSVAYIDHNTLQTGSENADDHKYIQSVASKYGILFSKPGNGVCHQVHIERYGVPGKTLLGSDSHTPTCGGIGMLAIGAGGLDVAVAMGGGGYYLTMPEIIKVELTGKLNPWVSAKDIIMEVLRILTVKGGVGKIVEYGGEGIQYLSVPDRATITNMGAELGATTSIFPSDENTRRFLISQGREEVFVPLAADFDAEYDEKITIDLSKLEPLAAQPFSPDLVDTVKSIGPIEIDQVCIGSCTNSSYMDMMKTAKILKGRKVHDNVSLTISPGSMQVFSMIAENGALTDMITAGARILEVACGPCIGMGQSPKNNAVSLRTHNRNFYGRSGTPSARVYLVSPETAAWSAIKGTLSDPRELGGESYVELPEKYIINDNLILRPSDTPESVEIVRGPNIKPFPKAKPMEDYIKGEVLIVLGDNITTDHIMPSNAKLLPFRSNVPYLADFCLTPSDPDFPARAKEKGGGFIVAGSNYGQGSSREHAALAPLQLGVKGVIAKSFARIHMANLMNNGILPLVFEDENEYDNIKPGDVIEIKSMLDSFAKGGKIVLTLSNLTQNKEFNAVIEVSQRQSDILRAGGLLNYTSSKREDS